MASPKRISLATIGSLGDLHPMLALAQELRERGHHPVILSTELYRGKVQKLGLEFHALRPDTGATNPETMRILMDMRRGPEFLLRQLILPAIRDTYEDLISVASTTDLLVAGEIVFAAPIVAEKLKKPWVSAILSPFSFYSAYDPPVSPFAPEMNVLNPSVRLLNRAFLQLGRLATRPWWKPVLQLRRDLGLNTSGNPLFEDKFSPDLTLALFSSELAQPQPDWPPNTLQPGFVYYDSGEEQAGLPAQLVAFLDAGEPPIVFTLGSSAVHDPRRFFIESAKAAELLGRRAVLLIGDNQPPPGLSSDILTVSYAAFSELFLRASIVVHQGGSGTTAQALRAGKAALIMPRGFDQPDNAARVQRIGAGLTISRNRYQAAKVALKLKSLLEDRRYSEKAEEIGRRLLTEDGLLNACDAIESLLGRPHGAVTAPDFR